MTGGTDRGGEQPATGGSFSRPACIYGNRRRGKPDHEGHGRHAAGGRSPAEGGERGERECVHV